MNAKLLSLALVTATMSALPAHAATVWLGGSAAGDGSGLTSTYVAGIDPSNTAGQFTTGSGTFLLDTFTLLSQFGKGCGSNTLAAGNATISSSFGQPNGYGFANQSSSGQYAEPAGDTTCFAFGPNVGGDSLVNSGNPDTVTINFAPLLAKLPNGSYINYFGLYYGSIDSYNNVSFSGVNGALTTVTGTQILNQLGGSSGNQQNASSNAYVNVLFDQADAFNAFTFSTTGVAFEMDNLVIGIGVPAQVPEPGPLSLLGAGLAALAVISRRKQAN